MKKNDTNPLMVWLNTQIDKVNSAIEEAQITKNYGKQTHYSGMKQAYLEILNQLSIDNKTMV